MEALVLHIAVFIFVNLFHLNISMHIPQSVPYIFPMVLTRRICFTIRSFFRWWSFLVILWPSRVIQGWYCGVEVRRQSAWGIKGLKVQKSQLRRIIPIQLAWQESPYRFLTCNNVLGHNINCCFSSNRTGVPASEFEFRPYVKDIYQCTLVRLKAADIDQEVKERAISCM